MIENTPQSATGSIERINSYPTEEETKQRFDNLLENMKSHKGQFVLMITRSWEPTLFDAPRTRNDYLIEENTFLGIVKKPFIKDLDQTFEIVSKEHINMRNRFDRKMELQKGNIKPSFRFSKYDLERPLKEQADLLRGRTGVALKIVVGDQAVMDYFDDMTWPNIIISKSDREEMQRVQPELFNLQKESWYDIGPLVTFAKMANKLGRPLPELSQDVEEEINREKKQIIEKLLILSKKGGNIEWEVKSTVAQAFELDMHKDNVVISEEIQPGIKTEIDVPKFINSYCQLYRIPLPKE